MQCSTRFSELYIFLERLKSDLLYTELRADFGNSHKGEKATNILQTEEGQIAILNSEK